MLSRSMGRNEAPVSAPFVLPDLREGRILHNCGIVGVWAPGEDVANMVMSATYNLSHRGQEGAGILIARRDADFLAKGAGLPRDVVDRKHPEPELPAVASLAQLRAHNGHSAIAQMRYSTSGEADAWQPFYDKRTRFGLVHNGNFVNVDVMLDIIPEAKRREAVSDSWVAHQAVLHAPGQNWEEKIRYATERFAGAYSLIMQTPNQLFGVRDPWGMKPLIVGQLSNGGYILASETGVLPSLKAKLVRTLEPGEGVVIDEEGMRTIFVDKRAQITKPDLFRFQQAGAQEKVNPASCAFEHVYIQRPDSVIEGRSVGQIRMQLGAVLAQRDKGERRKKSQTVVVGVQDSGTVYAQGYSNESGMPMVAGLVKNNYAPTPGRVFQMPGEPGAREAATAFKHNVDPWLIAGKHVVLVDDSLVRGITMRGIIKQLREAYLTYADQGCEPPASIEVRIASPMIMHPCYYGVDFSTRAELAHNGGSFDAVEAIKKDIGADSLKYITAHELVEAITGKPVDRNLSEAEVFAQNGLCGHCFTGKMPIPVESLLRKVGTKYTPNDTN